MLEEFNLSEIQEKIGYEFNNPVLLEQAFICPSITAASDRKIQNYQIMEFIGDSVLNFAIVKKLTDRHCWISCDGQFFSECNEGKMAVKKMEMENNAELHYCSCVLDLNRFIKRDRHFSYADSKNKKGDLIEAILGAVALDSNWNLDIICRVVQNILSKGSGYIVNENIQANINSISKLNLMYQSLLVDKPIYEFSTSSTDGNTIWHCSATLQSLEYEFSASSVKKSEAKRLAADALYAFITKTKDNEIEMRFEDKNVVRGQGLLKLIMSKYFNCKNAA